MRDEQALKRNADGTIGIVTVYRDADGHRYVDPKAADYGTPSERLACTGEGTTIKGWGELDGPAAVYRTPAGMEILLAEYAT